ncbi:hypothetical protein F4677DRAFT_405185 [Hypoxylon crocopeplum]|nr:hypothetical protein F4677DRAFT_405185 [Hypoxylon crocopeplum]
MLRAHLGRISLQTHRSLIGAGLPKRTFGSSIPGGRTKRPQVPILKPSLWALAATTTIYVWCATYDVYQDVQDAKRKGWFREGSANSFQDLEAAKSRSRTQHITSRSSSSAWYPLGLGEMLAGFSDAEKVNLCAMALNISLFGATSLAPGAFMQHFSHVPISSPNYTLLTSVFGHSGLLHLGVNTLMLLQLGPGVARSKTFEGNGGHFAAFFLSAGILSSLGDQLATTLWTRTYWANRFAPAMGASGVIMAMLGVWATTNPNAEVGIMFLPGSYSIQNVVAAMVLFEACGLFIGFPFFNIGHGAHLAGLAVGSAYVYFDGKRYMWRPSRRLAFNTMKRLHIV